MDLDWIWSGSGSIWVDLGRAGWIWGGSGLDLLFGVDFPLAAQNCERIPKTRVSRFFALYPLISAFQALACINADRSRHDLSIGIKTYQFHAMWLGIEPFLCSAYALPTTFAGRAKVVGKSSESRWQLRENQDEFDLPTVCRRFVDDFFG